MRHPFPALFFRPTTADAQAGQRSTLELMVPVNGTRRVDFFVERNAKFISA